MKIRISFEDAIFAIFLAAAIVIFLWFVFGKTPTLEQGLLVALAGLTVRNHGDLKELRGMLAEHLRKHR